MKLLATIVLLPLLLFAVTDLELYEQLVTDQAKLSQETNTTEIRNLKYTINQTKAQLNTLAVSPTRKVYSAPVTTLDASFYMHSLSIYEWTGNLLRISALIRNMSTDYINPTELVLHFYKNSVLQSTEIIPIDYVSYSKLGVLPFHETYVEGFAQMVDFDYVLIQVNEYATRKEVDYTLAESLLQVQESAFTKVSSDTTQWTGSIKNTSASTVKYPQVYFVFYNGHTFVDVRRFDVEVDPADPTNVTFSPGAEATANITMANLPAYDKVMVRTYYNLSSKTGGTSSNIVPNSAKLNRKYFHADADGIVKLKMYLFDPNRDRMSYQVDWGDGNISDWSIWHHHENIIKVQHMYMVPGEYDIKIRVKDINEAMTDWEEPTGVIVSSVVPVELASFEAQEKLGRIELKWHTATETNNLGFNIMKSTDNVNWQRIEFVKGHGTTLEPRSYSYVDESEFENNTYYRLEQVDADGSVNLSKVVSVLAERPEDFNIMTNYPNPFNASTTIKYELPKDSDITIDVLNLLGEWIATLDEGYKAAGVHTLHWDAGNVPTGAYFIRMQTQNTHFMKRCMVIK